MFFPERIKSINSNDKVLEIGPGSSPHARADVFLERKFDSDKEKLAQSGYAKPAELDKKVYFYDGEKFPFVDKEFDYIICSHVIEHIPISELDNFLSEISRVSSKGYIEFPTVFYELINFQPVHKWFMNYRNNEMIFLDKKIFRSNFIHKIYREMFYGKDDYLMKIFTRYRELFFSGFEWEDDIKYRIVDGFEKLVNDDDFKKLEAYFKNFSEI